MTLAPEVEAARHVARPESPYVGLVPFGEDDARFFFGRSTEVSGPSDQLMYIIRHMTPQRSEPRASQ